MKYNILLALLLIAGCKTPNWDPPLAYNYWKKDGKAIPYEILEKDMLGCGFNNTANNVDMPLHDYLKSAICMEKKGYIFDEMPICQVIVYREACKKYHLE